MRIKTVISPVLTLLLIFSCLRADAGSISVPLHPGKTVTLGGAQCDQIPELPPEFTLNFHKEYFVVTIKTPYYPGSEPAAAGQRNDHEAMFTKDIAEFFVSPDEKSGIYYHIALNPAGLCYTAKKRDTSWDPDIKTRVTRKNNCWIARMQIPYKEINTRAPDAATIWRANFAAVVPVGSGNRKSASWSDAADFHRIAEFGTIRFDGLALPQLLDWSCRNTELSATLYVPPRYAKAKALCVIDGKKYPGRISGSLCSWKLPLSGKDVYAKCASKISVTLTSEDGKTLFFRTAHAELQSNKDLVINGFYFPKDMKSLSYRQTFGKAVLLIKDDNDRIIARYPAKDSGNIPLTDLAPGRYIIELVSDQHRTSRLILLLPGSLQQPAIPDDARFEVRKNVFHLAGEPVFLFGGSTTPRAYLRNTAAFNMNSGNHGVDKNAVQVKGLAQLRYIRKPYPTYLLHPDADKIIAKRLVPVQPGNRQIIRLAYEAQIQLSCGSSKSPRKMNTPEYYANLYKRLKKQYPARYFSIHVDRADCLDDFAEIGDIIEFASWRSSYAVRMIPQLENTMREFRRKAGTRPAIFWLGGSIPDPRCRSAEELRAAVYTAIICGLNGSVVHLGHGGVKADRSRFWSLLSGINAEIQPVYREFVRGKEAKDFVRKVEGDFIWSARKCGNRILLIVINQRGCDQLLKIDTAYGKTEKRLTPFEPWCVFIPMR